MAEERAQRRLAAILAADVVGHGRLMQADEAGTVVALKARLQEIIQPLVAQHHGRVVKLMGDGVLVEFASAVDAIECAVQLPEAMGGANAELLDDRKIVWRMGVNLGDVLVEDNDLYGDGVNIAARLEGLADPGGIYLSQTVFAHVRGKVALGFEDLGDQRLKNMADPVRVYRVRPGDASPTTKPVLALPDKPSIAVLPFVNMSGDSEQEYFADGITEDRSPRYLEFGGFSLSRATHASPTRGNRRTFVRWLAGLAWPLARANGRIDDYRRALPEQRQGLLNREVIPFEIDGYHLVEALLCHLFEQKDSL